MGKVFSLILAFVLGLFLSPAIFPEGPVAAIQHLVNQIRRDLPIKN
jgi:ABC-type phosphate/phosphonate transport system permease subunit